jgi:predicted Zn-dependent protease
VSRTFTAVLIFVILGHSPAQRPSVPSKSPSIGVHASEGTGAAFRFTKVDDDLRAEADAIDDQYEKRGLVLHDQNLQAFIDATGMRVLGELPVPEKVTYRFLVLRDPTVNAFSLPNGSVYITTGILALLDNEAELAGVLGHETAHVYERHAYLENRSIRKKTVASEIIAAASAWVPGGLCGVAGNGRGRECEHDSAGGKCLRLFPGDGETGRPLRDRGDDLGGVRSARHGRFFRTA